MSTARYGSLSALHFLTPGKHVPYYCTVHAPRDAGKIANVAGQAFIAQCCASAKVVCLSRMDLVAGQNTGWMDIDRQFDSGTVLTI